MLAIDIVTSGKQVSTSTTAPGPTSTIHISTASLDFGLLAAGEQAVQTFDIQGGPGQIVVESDQLQVTPTRFSGGLIRVRVEVKPLNGELLQSSLL